MKGYAFTIFTVTLFALAVFSVLESEKVQTREENTLLATRAVTIAWHDINEDLVYTLDLNVSRQEENVSFEDSIPANNNITQALSAYEKFIENNYSSSYLNATFTPKLRQTQPPIEISPIGFYYTYPDWAKHQLEINSSEQNFSMLKNLTMTLNITSHWFDQNFTGKCKGGQADWNSFEKCEDGDEEFCLFLELKIIDANSTVYDNNCTPIEIDNQNVLPIRLKNNTGAESVNLQFGAMGGGGHDEVFFLDLIGKGVKINSSIKFTFNNSNYEVAVTPSLTTEITKHKTSKTKRVG